MLWFMGFKKKDGFPLYSRLIVDLWMKPNAIYVRGYWIVQFWIWSKQSYRSAVYPSKVNHTIQYSSHGNHCTNESLPRAQLQNKKFPSQVERQSGLKKPRNNQKLTSSSTQCAKTIHVRWLLFISHPEAIDLPHHTNNPFSNVVLQRDRKLQKRCIDDGPPSHSYIHSHQHCIIWEASYCFLLFWIWCCLGPHQDAANCCCQVCFVIFESTNIFEFSLFVTYTYIEKRKNNAIDI